MSPWEEQFERILNKHKAKNSSEPVYLAKALRECAYVGFGDANPAKACMDRFLGNTGDPWEFGLSELFAADAGAKERVYHEVLRRSLGLLTLREKAKAVPSPIRLPRYAPTSGQGVLKPEELEKKYDELIDPCITIFQQNYKSRGWWGALGTFPVVYKREGRSDDGTRIFVKLSGENIYDWHPTDKNRSTQMLHQWAARLIELGAAKPFNMKAKSRTFSIDVLTRSLLEEKDALTGVMSFWNDTQTNSDYGGGGDVWEMAKRLVKTYW